MVQDVKPGGFFLLNCTWSDDELEEKLPGKVKRYIAQNNVQFYTCDAVTMAKEIGLGARRTNSILQAAFFKLADIIPIEEAEGYMKDAIAKTYKKKGQDIVDMNCKAVDAGLNHIHKVEVPESWKNAEDDAPAAPLVGRDKLHTEFLNDILVPTANLTADNVPVSKFMDTVTGMMPAGTAAYEKRGVAADLPHWDVKNCMQCNWCASVCPHAVVRPFVMTAEEAEGVADAVPMKGAKDKKFTLGWSLHWTAQAAVPAQRYALRETRLIDHGTGRRSASCTRHRQNTIICIRMLTKRKRRSRKAPSKGAQLKTAAAWSSPALALAAAKLLTRSW